MESTAGKPTGHLCLSKPRPPPASSPSRHPGPMGRTYAVKTSYKHSTKKRTHNAEKRKHRGIGGLVRGAAEPDTPSPGVQRSPPNLVRERYRGHGGSAERMFGNAPAGCSGSAVRTRASCVQGRRWTQRQCQTAASVPAPYMSVFGVNRSTGWSASAESIGNTGAPRHGTSKALRPNWRTYLAPTTETRSIQKDATEDPFGSLCSPRASRASDARLVQTPHPRGRGPLESGHRGLCPSLRGFLGGTASPPSATIGGHTQVFGFTTETRRTQRGVRCSAKGTGGPASSPSARTRAQGTAPLPGGVRRPTNGHMGLCPSLNGSLGGTASSPSARTRAQRLRPSPLHLHHKMSPCFSSVSSVPLRCRRGEG